MCVEIALRWIARKANYKNRIKGVELFNKDNQKFITLNGIEGNFAILFHFILV